MHTENSDQVNSQQTNAAHIYPVLVDVKIQFWEQAEVLL